MSSYANIYEGLSILYHLKLSTSSCSILKNLNLYLDNSIANIADGAKGRFGEIDSSPAFKGAAVIDLDHYALAIGEVGDPHHGAKGQFHMGGAIEVVTI